MNKVLTSSKLETQLELDLKSHSQPSAHSAASICCIFRLLKDGTIKIQGELRGAMALSQQMEKVGEPS